MPPIDHQMDSGRPCLRSANPKGALCLYPRRISWRGCSIVARNKGVSTTYTLSLRVKYHRCLGPGQARRRCWITGNGETRRTASIGREVREASLRDFVLSHSHESQKICRVSRDMCTSRVNPQSPWPVDGGKRHSSRALLIPITAERCRARPLASNCPAASN